MTSTSSSGPDDPSAALRHGDGSADWLSRRGHPELARAVADHPVTRLADGEAFRRWSAFATREERIVAYADKRAGPRLEPMAARFASWRRRYAELRQLGRADPGRGPRAGPHASRPTSAGRPGSCRPTCAGSLDGRGDRRGAGAR